MKKNTRTILQKCAVTSTALVFGLGLTATSILFENEDTITAALGQKNAEVIPGEIPEGFDTEYGFKTQFKSIKELVLHGYEVQEKEEAEGAVLLKNKDNALPLAKGSNVSVFGVTGASPFYGASGSGGINTTDAIDWYDGLEGKYHDADNLMKSQLNTSNKIFNVNQALATSYQNAINSKAEGYNAAYVPSSSTTKVNIGDIPWTDVTSLDGYSSVSEYNDAAIYIIKRTGGEGYDLPSTSGKNAQYGNSGYASPSVNDGVDGDYLQLSETEKSVLNGLKTLKSQGKIKKIVLLLNMASTIELDFLQDDRYDIDACMHVGSVGEVGTLAVAKLLCGEYNPSGKTSSTMWAKNLANPVNSNFTDQNYFFTYPNYADYNFINPAESEAYQSTMSTYMVYQEGMYLGYKYTETRYEDYVLGTSNVGNYNYNDVVAYPFGYGESYTNFSFGTPVFSKTGKTYKVSVEVTNSGSVAGKTPVQVYLGKPYGDYAKENSIQVPSVELVDFGKTDEIPAGGKDVVTIEVPEKYFASYDAEGAGTYVIMPGDYYLIVATDSHQAVNNLLAARNNLTPTGTGHKMDNLGDATMTKKYSYALDTQTYSVSDSTGNPIQNLFDFADINKYSGKGTNSVKYYNRNDWENTAKLCYRNTDGTLVKNNAKLTMTKQMAEDLRDQMDSSKVIQKGGEYPTYGADNGLKMLDMKGLSYDNNLWDDLLDQLTWDETVDLLSNGRHKTQPIEGIVKYSTGDENGPNGFNIRNYSKTSGGSAYSGPTHPYAERIDDPDLGAGYTSTGFSSNGVLASTFNKGISEEVGKQIGEEGYWGGMSGLLGGGFNIQRSPYAGRTAEYYSEDAMLTGLIGSPETKAIESMGVHCFVKHCALNESETGRHGVQEWINEQALRENYLRAFELVFTDGGAFNTMTAFNRLGTVAVANSDVFAQKWLRNEIGLKGIVETDCAGDMTDGRHGEAYVSRICNVYTGASDLNEYNYAVDAPEYNGSSVTYATFAPDASGNGEYGNLGVAMRKAAKRIIYSTLTSNAICGYTSTSSLVRLTPPWKKANIAIDITAGSLFGLSLIWVGTTAVIDFKKKAK